MQTENKVTIGAFALALITGISMLFVAAPTGWDGTYFAFHWSLASNGSMVWLHAGAATLFMLGLSAYKNRLRYAYLAIVASIVFIALGTMQLPIIDGYNLWQSAWVTHGGISIPFLVSGTAGYLGMRHLAKLVNIKTIATNVPAMLFVTILLSVLSALLPHTSNLTTSEVTYDISNGMLTWILLLYVLMFWLAVRTRSHMGQHYTEAMTGLVFALMTSSTVLTFVIVNALTTNNSHSLLLEFFNLVTIVAGFLWLRAGYLFAKTKEY